MSAPTHYPCPICTCTKHVCQLCGKMWGIGGIKHCEAYPHCGAQLDATMRARKWVHDLCQQHQEEHDEREAQRERQRLLERDRQRERQAAEKRSAPPPSPRPATVPSRRALTTREMAKSLPHRPQFRRPRRQRTPPPSTPPARPSSEEAESSLAQTMSSMGLTNEDAGSSREATRFLGAPFTEQQRREETPLETARRLRLLYTPTSTSPGRGGDFSNDPPMRLARPGAASEVYSGLAESSEEELGGNSGSPPLRERFGNFLRKMKSSSSLESGRGPGSSPEAKEKKRKDKGKNSKGA